MQKEIVQSTTLREENDGSCNPEETTKRIAKPLISIVLATKGNKVILLERCLKSLQKQTFRKFEIVVIYSIFPKGLNDFLSEGCNISVLKENSSKLSAARNLGIKYSKGEIVVFIDDDAEAPEDWLSKIYSTFQRYPSLFCLGGPHLTPLEEGEKKPLSFAHGSFMESHMGKVSLNRSAVGKIAGCNVAYRKVVFDKIGYLNEGLRTTEDWEFHIRLAENGYGMRFDPEIFVWHHRQGLKHAFLGSSNSVPFFLSWKTLKYSRYESAFASFYFSNLAFLFLLITLFVSPFIFFLFLFLLLLGHFILTATRTKMYNWRLFYYPLQVLITLSQIMGFYFGLFKTLVSYLSR